MNKHNHLVLTLYVLITEQLRLEGTPEDHLVQAPCSVISED